MYTQKAVPKKLNQVKTERGFRTSSTEPLISRQERLLEMPLKKNYSIFWTSYVQLTHGCSMITMLFQKSKPLESQEGHLPKVASLDKNHMLPRSHGPVPCLRTDSVPNSLPAEVHRQLSPLHSLTHLCIFHPFTLQSNPQWSHSFEDVHNERILTAVPVGRNRLNVCTPMAKSGVALDLDEAPTP